MNSKWKIKLYRTEITHHNRTTSKKKMKKIRPTKRVYLWTSSRLYSLIFRNGSNCTCVDFMWVHFFKARQRQFFILLCNSFSVRFDFYRVFCSQLFWTFSSLQSRAHAAAEVCNDNCCGKSNDNDTDEMLFFVCVCLVNLCTHLLLFFGNYFRMAIFVFAHISCGGREIGEIEWW